MERDCFQLQGEPERIDAHVERPRAVRPRMLRAVERSGRRNSSLLLREDGLLVGCSETDDDAVSAKRLAEDPDAADWEAQSADLFVPLPGPGPTRACRGCPRCSTSRTSSPGSPTTPREPLASARRMPHA